MKALSPLAVLLLLLIIARAGFFFFHLSMDLDVMNRFGFPDQRIWITGWVISNLVLSLILFIGFLVVLVRYVVLANVRVLILLFTGISAFHKGVVAGLVMLAWRIGAYFAVMMSLVVAYVLVSYAFGVIDYKLASKWGFTAFTVVPRGQATRLLDGGSSQAFGLSYQITYYNKLPVNSHNGDDDMVWSRRIEGVGIIYSRMLECVFDSKLLSVDDTRLVSRDWDSSEVTDIQPSNSIGIYEYEGGFVEYLAVWNLILFCMTGIYLLQSKLWFLRRGRVGTEISFAAE